MGTVLALAAIFAAVILPGIPAIPAEEEASDPRLSQRVTIDCVNVRLHTALDMISKKTGVTIRTGRNKDDWRVRDIPVVVCARDLPLGKLLQTIADATHLLVSSREIDGVRTYRIWRDRKREKELAAYYEETRAARRTAAAHDWDQWSQLNDIPDSEFKEGPARGSRVREEARAISRLVAALGPEARDRVLAGEVLRLELGTAPAWVREDLRACFQEIWTSFETVQSKNTHPEGLFGCGTCHQWAPTSKKRGPTTPEEVRSAVLDKSTLTIYLNQCGEPGAESLKVSLQAGYASRGGDLGLDVVRRATRQEQYKLPPPPQMPPPPRPGDLSAKYISIDPFGGAGKPAVLQRRLTPDAPKNSETPTYADVLAAVSKAAGISIVCEDFASHSGTLVTVLGGAAKPVDVFGRQWTIGNILMMPIASAAWWFDEAGNTIVGTDKEWPERLKNLVPEAVIEELMTRLNGPGVELDDLAPLVSLTPGQCSEWLGRRDVTARLASLAATLVEGRSLWPLYYRLTTSDRIKARSAAGVRIARYGYPDAGYETECQIEPFSDLDPERRAFLHPEVLATAIMRITSEGTKDGKTTYSLRMEAEKNGEKVEAVEDIGPFPIRSPAREAELRKNASGAETK